MADNENEPRSSELRRGKWRLVTISLAYELGRSRTLFGGSVSGASTGVNGLENEENGSS